MVKLEEFLAKKWDYSPLLVHLTKDDELFYAEDILNLILHEKTLKALRHHCLFDKKLKEPQNVSLRNKFNVVCFTETPINLINVLLEELERRKFKPKPYGLVFKKEYIRKRGGNPVFYVTGKIAGPLWQPFNEEKIQLSDEACKLLALVTMCQEGNDWHWEREWRIVGDLHFKLEDIYCGLCPEEDIAYFEKEFKAVKFISPSWGINKILDKLVMQLKQ